MLCSLFETEAAERVESHASETAANAVTTSLLLHVPQERTKIELPNNTSDRTRALWNVLKAQICVLYHAYHEYRLKTLLVYIYQDFFVWRSNLFSCNVSEHFIWRLMMGSVCVSEHLWFLQWFIYNREERNGHTQLADWFDLEV